MGTGTSKRTLALAALTLGLAGCGAAGNGSAAHGSASQPSASSSSAPSGTAAGSSAAQGGSGGSTAFAWLRPQAPPSNWRIAPISDGATMSYPPNWRRQHSDPGTATAIVTGTNNQILGYLNLTPRQGSETLANWTSFRVHHNADEGDKHVKRLAAGTGLRFRDGHGACVKDSYTSFTGAHYVEIACLVAGPRGKAVIVAAAPPAAWTAESGTLQRAIDGVRA